MNTNKPDTGNYLAALVLSIMVLMLWQFFFVDPMVEEQRKAAEIAASQPANTLLPELAAPSAPKPREEVLGTSGPRLKFENGVMEGSIRLKGFHIDDLRFKHYRETLDPKSPQVVFLSPQGSPVATFAKFGWVSPDTTVKLPDDESVWTPSEPKLSDKSAVTLTWDNGQGLIFTREVTLDENFMFTVKDSVTNTTPAALKLFPYAIMSREGEPVHEVNWTLHEGLLGVQKELLEKFTYQDMRDAKPQEIVFEGKGGWLGITDKYWMATIIPPQDKPHTGRFVLLKNGANEIFQTDYRFAPETIAAGATTTLTHHFFAGAKIVSLVEDYQKKLGIYRYEMTIDWGWFSIITYWMFQALDQLNKFSGNFGVAIILLTILVKILFFPLANRSYESMTKMKKIQPEMKLLQDRFKDDRMKMQQELMALYKREKVNPLMGCVPILLSIPIFFSLYKVLFVTIEMRHAPFFGWIQDLAAADPTSVFNLFGLLPFGVPDWLQIGVWPTVMGLTMWVQMKMSPPSPDPTQRQVMAIMPPVFTYLMALFPSGLVIYWTVNNVLSIAQQYVIMRRLNVPLDLSIKVPEFVTNLWAKRSSPPPSKD